MERFLAALGKWAGPEAVEMELAKRKLLVASEYRREIIEFCNSKDVQSDVSLYWSECAKERILSGGRADPDRRRNLDGTLYRSSYLDALAREIEDGAGKPRSPRLHPCIRCWINADETSRGELGKSLWQRLEEFKERERQIHAIVAEGWTGLKKETRKFLQQFAIQRGYVEGNIELKELFATKRRMFYKRTSSGLIFCCAVDTGIREPITYRLPIMFFATHESNESRPMVLAPNVMYYGADYYAVFRSDALAIFGIYALTELFDAFVGTF